MQAINSPLVRLHQFAIAFCICITLCAGTIAWLSAYQEPFIVVEPTTAFVQVICSTILAVLSTLYALVAAYFIFRRWWHPIWSATVIWSLLCSALLAFCRLGLHPRRCSPLPLTNTPAMNRAMAVRAMQQRLSIAELLDNQLALAQSDLLTSPPPPSSPPPTVPPASRSRRNWNKLQKIVALTQK